MSEKIKKYLNVEEKSPRNTQTLIDGNKISINKGDLIKFDYFSLNKEDSEPSSVDIHINNKCVGCLNINNAEELFLELFEQSKS